MPTNAIEAKIVSNALTTCPAAEQDCKQKPKGLQFLSKAAGRNGEINQLLKRYTTGFGSISDAADYHLASGGKLFRPQFVLSIATALGVREATAFNIAAACELLHNASLVHDDLQDKDEIRRGQPAVWKALGPETAINLGDFFIAGTFQALAEIEFWVCRIRGSEAVDRSIARMNAAIIEVSTLLENFRPRVKSIISAGQSRMLK
jgi:geranylgeranyl pyrophosphate synthase